VVVTDLNEFIRAVADGKIPIEAVQPNWTYIYQEAAKLDGGLSWPGTHSYRA
jgi:hypothetical protein